MNLARGNAEAHSEGGLQTNSCFLLFRGGGLVVMRSDVERRPWGQEDYHIELRRSDSIEQRKRVVR